MKAPRALAILLVCAAYYVGARIGFAFSFPPMPTSVFWLPNSIMFAVLLLVPVRSWWMYIAAVVPAHVAVQVQNDVPIAAMLLLFVTNVGDGALGALGVRRFSRGEPRFDSLRNTLVFVIFSVAAPFLVSFLDAAVVVFTDWGNDYWPIWHTRFRSNALTNLIWVPAIVVLCTRGLAWIKACSARRCPEAALLALAVYLVGAFEFGSPGDVSSSMVALLYLPLPLFLWAAARFGTGGISACLLGFAWLVTFNAVHGRGPFAAYSPNENVLAIQAFLTLLSVPFLLLAALIEDQRRTQLALREGHLLLEQRVAERTRALQTLLEISKTVASTLELTPLLNVVLERLQMVVQYSSAALLIQDDEELVILGYRGPLAAEQVSGRRVASAEACDWLSSQRNGPVIVQDVRDDSTITKEFHDTTPRDLKFLFSQSRSILVVPLKTRERTIGVLLIDASEPGQYTAHDAELAWLFANQAAVAIENAQLYDQARELAAFEERQRLARDLHDSVTQTLHAMDRVTERLPRVWEDDPAEGRRGLDSLRGMTRIAFAELRTLLLELRPVELLEGDLGDQLGELTKGLGARLAVPLHVEVERSVKLPPEVHVAFYRIAQEALTNIVKHAEASNIGVTLRRTEHGAMLRVSDDGIGFDSAKVLPDKLGVKSMSERAAAIGAVLRFDSRLGEGLTVMLDWHQASAQQSGRNKRMPLTSN